MAGGRRTGRDIRSLVVEGRLSAVARPAVRSSVSAELAAAELVDRLAGTRPRARSGRVGQDATAVIKTFERPRLLRRLVASIRRVAPDLPVVVVDDSREPAAVDGVELVRLPYDSGVSAGRSAGLDRVATEYVVMLDDDHVFYRRTDLASTLAVMDEHPEIDLVGGKVVNLPLLRAADYRSAPLFPTDAEPRVTPGTRIGGLAVFEKVASFWVGRADRVREVGWDPRLKRMEHRDFFTRARGVLTTVYNPEMRCLHAPDLFDVAYMAKRNDVGPDQRIVAERWYPTAPGDDG